MGEPSQTKDASPNNLAEKLFACIEIVQRSRTVGTHHKFIPKPGGMLANTFVSLQIVIHRSSKMSLEQDLKQPARSSILVDLDNFSRRNIFSYSQFFITAPGSSKHIVNSPLSSNLPPPLLGMRQNRDLSISENAKIGEARHSTTISYFHHFCELWSTIKKIAAPNTE